ncbi:MAG TPA: DUF6249 domain-containing protein [Steroidobacteraceae bacterium]|nr:DUF6249 domain-containing protein [Steroidobacteraceae bacterium]
MDIEVLALLIPISMIVLGVATAIVAIVTSHRRRLQRDDMRHKERMAAIEKGMELPPDPVETGPGAKTGGLRSGIGGILVGVVLYLALRGVADEDVALFGLIPAAIGIASLVSWLVEGRRNPNGR